MQDFPYPRDEKLNWRIQWAKKLFKALLHATKQSENRKIKVFKRNLIGKFQTNHSGFSIPRKKVSVNTKLNKS